MPALDLMLGTRRLRRRIEQQTQQLQRDIEHEQHARAQFRQTFAARATSPLGLLSAAGAGFVAGKVAARPKQSDRHPIANIAALALIAARSIGMQVIVPMAVEWVQSKFAKRKKQEGADADVQAQNDKLPSSEA